MIKYRLEFKNNPKSNLEEKNHFPLKKKKAFPQLSSLSTPELAAIQKIPEPGNVHFLVFRLLVGFWNIQISTVLFNCSLFLHSNHHGYFYQFKMVKAKQTQFSGRPHLPIMHASPSHHSLCCCCLSYFQHATGLLKWARSVLHIWVGFKKIGEEEGGKGA